MAGIRRILSALVVNPRVSDLMNHVELVHNYLSLVETEWWVPRRLTRPPGTRTKHTPPSFVVLFLLPRREEFVLLVFENQIGVGECLRKPGATSPDNICSFGVVIVF